MAKGREAPSAAPAPADRSVSPLIERLQTAYREAEKARDHHGAAALNSVLVALGDAKHKARTALAAVDETLDGRILREAQAMVPEVRDILEMVAKI